MTRYFITMPQLGESVTEGVIARWLVAPGDKLVEFDPMVEINTDKVDAEVPAPVTGVLAEILEPEGAVVPVGANIAIVEIDAVDDPNVGIVAAKGRHLPTTVTTSGSQQTAPQPSGVTQPLEPAVAGPPGPGLDEDEVVALTPTRRLIAERMVRAKSTIPHAWQTQEVDMSGAAASLVANRFDAQRQNGASLSYLVYVVAGVAASLRVHPVVNSTFEENHIVMHRAINIGIPVGLPDGVIVPVIRRADRLSIAELATAIADVVRRGRERQLSAAELTGATITVNNSGALGPVLSYSVITPGQSAVVTMGAVVVRPVAVDNNVALRPIMYLSLSLDHRVMDGLEAAAFLGDCRKWLEGVTLGTPLWTPSERVNLAPPELQL